MVLFGRCHCPYPDAERLLGRRLGGSPSEGEIAILGALNGDRFQVVREAIERDELADDFRALVASRLDLVDAHNGRYSTHRVRLPIETLNHYQALSQRTKLSVGECLEQAIARDRQAYDDAAHAAQALERAVESYHKAAEHVAKTLADLTERVGPLQEITARLGRIEGTLQAIAQRR